MEHEKEITILLPETLSYGLINQATRFPAASVHYKYDAECQLLHCKGSFTDWDGGKKLWNQYFNDNKSPYGSFRSEGGLLLSASVRASGTMTDFQYDEKRNLVCAVTKPHPANGPHAGKRPVRQIRVLEYDTHPSPFSGVTNYPFVYPSLFPEISKYWSEFSFVRSESEDRKSLDYWWLLSRNNPLQIIVDMVDAETTGNRKESYPIGFSYRYNEYGYPEHISEYGSDGDPIAESVYTYLGKNKL